jgi:hypothetical protein
VRPAVRAEEVEAAVVPLVEVRAPAAVAEAARAAEVAAVVAAVVAAAALVVVAVQVAAVVVAAEPAARAAVRHPFQSLMARKELRQDQLSSLYALSPSVYSRRRTLLVHY